MDELPWWLALRDPDGMPAQVMRELWQDSAFAQQIASVLAPSDRFPFAVHIGGRPLFDEIARGKASWDAEGGATGAATIFNAAQEGEPASQAGIAIDVDRILSAAGGDSAQARQMIRDALIHEFGHVLPVAQSRNVADRTGDPKPDDPNAAQHPAIQAENELRALLGLKPKRHYGLLDPTLR